MTRRMKSSWPGGSVIALRSTASLPSLGEVTTSQPALPSGWLPTHTTATSRLRASSTAASLMSPTQSTPIAGRPGGPGLATRSMPLAGRHRVGRRAEYQSSSTVFASGPTTATDRTFARSSGQQARRVLEQHDRLPRHLAHQRARLRLAQGSGSPRAPIVA